MEEIYLPWPRKVSFLIICQKIRNRLLHKKTQLRIFCFESFLNKFNTEVAAWWCSVEKVLLKFHKIDRKVPVSESL